MIARLLNSFAARRLSKHGHAKSHNRILAKARAIREELGLAPDRRLAG
jgi:hypothetical protein